jgi:dienelactone hydrolase
MKAGAKAPAILMMHGCAGVVRGAVGHRAYLMSEGYAIFEPDSVARPGRPPCKPDRGGYSGTGFDRKQIGALRYEEIALALDRIHELPWVDHNRVVLMGISEGGWAVSRWEKPGFAAHIIVSAACVADDGRPRAPENVPVLAMVGSQDGHSCSVTRGVGGSRSIVIPGAPHDIMNRREVRDALDVFLRECCQ